MLFIAETARCAVFVEVCKLGMIYIHVTVSLVLYIHTI